MSRLNKMTKRDEIIGYAADANIICIGCKTDIYGEHDVDNEGNEIHPVFAGDEGEHMCGSCGCNLMED